jgi:murein DD-endopeptidase MepM/ murein hydrolase activator NlpD
LGILTFEVKNMENNSKGSKSNKAFTIAVAISLTMVIVACAVAYPQVISPEVSDLAELTESTEEVTSISEELAPVENIETNIPKSTTSVEVVTEPMEAVTSAEVSTTDTTEPITQAPLDFDSPKLPVVGEVINEFSNGELVKSATSGIWQTHNGVDFSTEDNATVESVADGTVIKVWEDALLGVCVTIDHTEFVANYCNLDKVLLVSEGDIVEIGDIIGNVGDTAVSETALDTHIHFETLQGGKYVNPLDLLE